MENSIGFSLYKFNKYKLDKYKKFRPAVFFSLGFLFDIITLGRVDNIFSLAQQCLYIGVAGLLLRQHFFEREQLWTPHTKIQKLWTYQNEAVHFFLGGLLSIYTLFFFISSSLSTSLLFLIALFSLLILNETSFFRTKNLTFKYCLYSICLYSFLLFLLPIILGTVGITAFLSSLIIGSLISFLNYRDTIKRGVNKDKAKKQILLPSLYVVLGFLILYFLKVLPPVPLSAQYMGVYHSLNKEGDIYQLGYTRPKWKFWQNGDQSFAAKSGDKIYCFVRIFAPTHVSGQIIFHWQNYQKDKWITTDKVPIPITGGRQNGYRAYTMKSNYQIGSWRVLLENEDGREISRIPIQITSDPSPDPANYNYDYH